MAKRSAGGVVQIVDENNDIVSSFGGVGGGTGLTDAELRATPVAVTGGGGGVEYTEGDTDATITGGVVMWEDTANTIVAASAAKPFPVSGPLTDTQLRATAVPVSGTVTASGPLTDAQLRATAVPVSGTVTASGPLTDTQLRATAVPVSLASAPSTAVTNAGTFLVQNNAATPAGTNNIGDVDVLTLPAIPAGSNNIGDVDIVTVPAPLSTTGGGTEATALRVTVANNSTGLLPVSLASVPSHAVTNAGTFAVQVDGAALTALQLIDNIVAGSEAQVDVVAALPAGTNNIGDVDVLTVPAPLSTTGGGTEATALRVTVANDSTGVVSIDDNGGSITVDGALTVDSGNLTVSGSLAIEPQTGNGLTIHRSIDLDEGTLEVVKSSAGAVYGMWVTNTATATRWIKFYNSTSGTAGTGTPVITIGIPGNTSDDVSGNFGASGYGISFSTGICVGATTGVADADTGAPAANDVIVNIFYK